MASDDILGSSIFQGTPDVKSYSKLFLTTDKKTQEKGALEVITSARNGFTKPVTPAMLIKSLNMVRPNFDNSKNIIILINLLNNSINFKNTLFNLSHDNLSHNNKSVNSTIKITINNISQDVLEAALGPHYKEYIKDKKHWLNEPSNKTLIDSIMIDINTFVKTSMTKDIKNLKVQLEEKLREHEFAYNLFARWDVPNGQKILPVATLKQIALTNPGAALGMLLNPKLKEKLLSELNGEEKKKLVENAKKISDHPDKYPKQQHYENATKILIDENHTRYSTSYLKKHVSSLRTGKRLFDFSDSVALYITNEPALWEQLDPEKQHWIMSGLNRWFGWFKKDIEEERKKIRDLHPIFKQKLDGEINQNQLDDLQEIEQGASIKTFEIPIKQVQTLVTPTKPVQTFETPIKAAQTFVTPTKPVQTFETPIKAAQTFVTPTKPVQTFETPIKAAQIFVTPTKPVQTFETPIKAAQTFVTPIKPGQTFETPIKAAQTFDTPFNDTDSNYMAHFGCESPLQFKNEERTSSPLLDGAEAEAQIEEIEKKKIEEKRKRNYNKSDLRPLSLNFNLPSLIKTTVTEQNPIINEGMVSQKKQSGYTIFK